MNRVVITGLGAITPLGNSVSLFWENMKAGRCGISEITRFDTSNYKVKLAAEVKDFDPLLYLDKHDLVRTDLYAQYAMAAACQAMADSGISDTVEAERFGVYFGTGIGGFDTFITEHQKLIEKGPRRVSPYFIPGMIANIASGMIAIRFGCKGSVMPIVTACASGSHAIGEAYRAILHGYADAMISGGAEATINGLAVSGFANMQALSQSTDPLAASLPFDKRRGGFVIGEGAGALVLESYDHAVARGAHIYAEVCGYGSTCDAYHVTAPDPEAGGSSRAIKQAYDEAGLATERIYINAHGTGTPMNDAAETKAIKLALGEELAQKVMISSTKSMTGHMLGAAGAVEAIVSVLALQEGVLPPTIGLLEADPECDLDYIPNEARKVEIDLALSSSLGFGGHNACLAFKKIGGEK